MNTRAGYLPWPEAGPEVDDFERFVASIPDRRAPFQAAKACFGGGIRSRDSGPEITRRALELADRGEPGSFIRIGDGEGNLLALGLDEHPALSEFCAHNRSVKHFGAPGVLAEGAPELLPAFHDALRDADVIGIHPQAALPMSLGSERDANQVSAAFGIATCYEYLARHSDDLRLDDTVGSAARFHRTLLPHYAELVKGRDVALVACHPELPEAMQAKMGARSVRFHAVPRQSKIISGPPTDTHHYPQRYHELLDELADAQPGMIYLVGAGILAKIYCAVIRRAGGVAIDIGSVADLWVGVASRFGVKRQAIEEWKIT